ncbi:hypothetical protein [Promicromonospora aerolata]|uniref:Uncharacterized protein n=1 Tax=Promicromonospora aerolata TaxID=195749 RepID=A0ABW4V2Z0_9MICO
MTPSSVSGLEPPNEEADAPDQMGTTGDMRTGTVVAAVSMGVGALLCFVLAAGFAGGRPGDSAQMSQELFALQERIRVAEAKTVALPGAEDADRGLVAALSASGQVAKLQNDYRYLTPHVAASGGDVDFDASLSGRRNLVPYFAPSVDQARLAPWYLLAGDKDVASGIGTPMSFDSGFEWVAQVPYAITDDSSVEVTWLALETRTGQGETPALLAWASAHYDMHRRTFSGVTTGTTATGEALRLEVTGS